MIMAQKNLNFDMAYQPPEVIKNLEIAPEIYQDMLRGVITQHKPELLHFNIMLLVCKKVRYKGFSRVLGRTKKFPPEAKFYHPYDAEIILDAKFCELYPEKIEPLLYHELCHLSVNDDYELILVDHDYSGFYAEINRFGDWTGEIEKINGFKISRQLEDLSVEIENIKISRQLEDHATDTV